MRLLPSPAADHRSLYDEHFAPPAIRNSAQCFRPTLVNIAKRSGLLEMSQPVKIRTPHADEPAADAAKAWAEFINGESAIRSGYAIAWLDAALPLLHGTAPSRAQSAFQMSLPLPAPSEEWNARTAEAWAHARRTRLETASGSMAVDNVEPSLSGAESDDLSFSDVLKQALSEHTYSQKVLSASLRLRRLQHAMFAERLSVAAASDVHAADDYQASLGRACRSSSPSSRSPGMPVSRRSTVRRDAGN